MKIVIILEDNENGHVKIEARPPIPHLVDAYKRGDPTPALTYAVLGIGKMLGDSDQIYSEQERERRDEMLRNKLILPFDTKQMKPTDVN